MDWRTNHLLLAEKLLKHIASSPDGVSIDAFDVRARSHGIHARVLDMALERLHKSRTVETKVRKGTVYYSLAVTKPAAPRTSISHTQWLNDNYPWPTEFIMPFPEIDMSYLFLTPDAMKEYKAAAKGMPVHMMKEYGRRS